MPLAPQGPLLQGTQSPGRDAVAAGEVVMVRPVDFESTTKPVLVSDAVLSTTRRPFSTAPVLVAHPGSDGGGSGSGDSGSHTSPSETPPHKRRKYPSSAARNKKKQAKKRPMPLRGSDTTVKALGPNHYRKCLI